jgi:cell division septal protein FtsQ
MPQVLIGKKETGGQKSLGLKEEDVQNEKFRAEQFGQLRRRKGRRLLWKITAIVLFVLTVILIALNMLFS